jgi:hypothetical protein
MRNLRKLLATIVLALALGAPAYAGDVPCPPAPPPPPPIVVPISGGDNSVVEAPASSGPETTGTPYCDLSQLAIHLIWGVLSIY